MILSTMHSDREEKSSLMSSVASVGTTPDRTGPDRIHRSGFHAGVQVGRPYTHKISMLVEDGGSILKYLQGVSHLEIKFCEVIQSECI